MRQLDDRLANESVVARMQRDNPTQTRFLIPPAEHARALAALDRSTQRYQEDREGSCRDLLGEAALRALEAMRCETCMDTIVESLATPDLALQAAWSLGALKNWPDSTELAFRQVLASPRHGPLSKRAAGQILDRRRK